MEGKIFSKGESRGPKIFIGSVRGGGGEVPKKGLPSSKDWQEGIHETG